jgi:hypothetical protein
LEVLSKEGMMWGVGAMGVADEQAGDMAFDGGQLQVGGKTPEVHAGQAVLT